MTTLRALSLAAALAVGAPLAAMAQQSPATPDNPSTSGAPATAGSVFKRVDANSDGKISKDEAASMPALAARFAELDRDKDGSLSMPEFLAGYSTAPKQ